MTLRKNKIGRYPLFDTVRGLCIVGMVLYHALFDCVFMFGLFQVPENILQIVFYIRDFGCILFVLLAGICEHFGKQKYKRAVLLLVCGAVVGLVFQVFTNQQSLTFGVLSFLGVATLLLQPLKKTILRLNNKFTFWIPLVLFLLLFNVSYGTFGVFGLKFGALPDFLYANTFTAILGFPPASFAAADYFPIIPWIFMYLFGFCLYPVLQKSSHFEKLSQINIRPIAFIGRYSLWFYLAHQPIILGILLLIAQLL